MQNGALRLPSPHPHTNTREVFKGKRTRCALSLPNDALADRVIDTQFWPQLVASCRST